MRANLPDRPQAPPPPEPVSGSVLVSEHRPRINRVLGATSGPYAGNTRAMLAVVLTVGFLVLFGFLAVEYLAFGRVTAQPLVEQGWGAILASFGLITGLYFGARTSQTGGG